MPSAAWLHIVGRRHTRLPPRAGPPLVGRDANATRTRILRSAGGGRAPARAGRRRKPTRAPPGTPGGCLLACPRLAAAMRPRLWPPCPAHTLENPVDAYGKWDRRFCPRGGPGLRSSDARRPQACSASSPVAFACGEHKRDLLGYNKLPSHRGQGSTAVTSAHMDLWLSSQPRPCGAPLSLRRRARRRLRIVALTPHNTYCTAPHRTTGQGRRHAASQRSQPGQPWRAAAAAGRPGRRTACGACG